jgi:predicted nuclease of predicted toxin-antitoxin system
LKLLLDQNLSPRLVNRLAALFPGSAHVSNLGLDRALDAEIWSYARANDCIIVTKDADFGDMGAIAGFPPKVIWLRLGNCTTLQIEQMLRRNHPTIGDFAADPNTGLLTLY